MQQTIEREQSLVRQFQDGTSVQRLAVLHRRSQRYVEDVLRQAMTANGGERK